jgi:tetratricopeptide (TPR) repeat protein
VLKNFQKIAFLSLVILLVSACVTQKKKGDVPWLKKRFKNMTAHYNGYFNANVLYQDALAKLSDQHQDNYNQILEVYPYEDVTAEQAKSIAGDVDNAVKKLSKVVALHRVSDWLDDAYLLVGQSYFLKKDYESAEETFRFATDEYNPEKPVKRKKGKSVKKSSSKKKKSATKKSTSKKKKKKKSPAKKKKSSSKSKSKSKTKDKKMNEKSFEDSPKKDEPKKEVEKKNDEEADFPTKPAGSKDPYAGTLFKKRSAFPDLQLWLGRTLTRRDKFDEAEFLFNQLESNPFFPKTLRADLATAQANNFLRQKNYDKAVDPLEKAIRLTKKRKDRARLAYILAQIHSKSGRSEQAVAAYQQVLRSRPIYDMEFSARLNMALNGFYTGSASEEATTKLLNKMLKDDKNIDYRDQIYFTLAQIDLKKGDKTAAIDHLQKSLAASRDNRNQKAESYLALAQLYFEKENFVASKNYYDSTLTVMLATDPRYKIATNYAKNLTEIAGYLTAITLNDSLRMIYHMTPEQKKALASKIKKDREDALELSAKAAAEPKIPTGPTAVPAFRPGAPAATGFATASSFYFYNDAGVKKGKKDFAKKWDDRANEDNWRRSQRNDKSESTETSPETASADEKGLTSEELDDLLPGIPKTARELATLDSITATNLFKLGKAYRDQLENNTRCAQTLERMFNEFAPYVKREELEAWFYCYLAFTDLKNQPKAAEYLEKLTGKYANSTFAKSITDPNFKDMTSQRERELSNFYKETYRMFQAADYLKASERCVESERKFGVTNILAPKFALLATMCQGSLIGKNGYCAALKEFIAKYPDSEEKVRATEIARNISCDGFLALPDPNEKKPEDGKPGEVYTLENDKLHYFMVVCTGGDVKLDNVKIDISDYNKQFHKLEQLRVSNIYLGTDTETPIIVIRKFDNRETAMKYFDELTKTKEFIKEKRVKTEYFAITQNNYRVLLGKKNFEEYRTFFADKYLK